MRTQRIAALAALTLLLTLSAAQAPAKRKVSHYDNAMYLKDQGKAEEALAELELSLKIDDEDPTVIAAKADLLYAKGFREQAVDAWEKAYRLSSDDPKFFQRMDMKPRSAEWIADGIAAHKASRIQLVQVYEIIAGEAAKESRWKDAAFHWSRITELAEEHEKAWAGLGKAAKKMKDSPTAYNAWGKAAALDPRNPDYFKELGYAAYGIQKLNEAEQAFRRYTALKPDEAMGYNNLGTLLAELSRFEESHAAFDKALTLQPNMVQALNGKGTAYYYKKDYANARAQWARVLELSPDDPKAKENIRTLVKMGF